MEQRSRPENDQAPSTPTTDLRDRKQVLSRRQWMGVAGGGVMTLATVFAFRRLGRGTEAAAISVTMYTSEDCPCCHKWAAHLKARGFVVRTVIVSDVSRKKDALGVPSDLRSCHTAEIEGYLVEGHVPAGDIKRFLAERSTERGLAVPGMPGGSPGMESDPKVPFDVIAFSADGATRVYAHA